MKTEPWKKWFLARHDEKIDNVKIGENFPAVGLHWREAKEFCEKFNDSERAAKRLPAGHSYSLPTEAQWEYACRASTTSAYSFGDDANGLYDHGWFIKNSAQPGELIHERSAREVGTSRPNLFGLFDMHGNVAEFCRDAYKKALPGGVDPEAAHDPTRGTIHSAKRVFRGGSFLNEARYCRSAQRTQVDPAGGSVSIGFRVALEASADAQ